MPQMAPMSWTILFMLFTLIFILFNLMNFFLVNYQIKTSENKKFSKIYSNWKW